MSREAIAERAIALLENSAVIAEDRGVPLHEAWHNGFKVWFWPLSQPNTWALRVHQAGRIVFRSYFNVSDRTYSIEKCMRGDWRTEFVATQQ